MEPLRLLFRGLSFRRHDGQQKSVKTWPQREVGQTELRTQKLISQVVPVSDAVVMEMEMESHGSVSIMKRRSQHKTTGRSLWRVSPSARCELHSHPLAEQAQACGRLKGGRAGGPDGTKSDHWCFQRREKHFSRILGMETMLMTQTSAIPRFRPHQKNT